MRFRELFKEQTVAPTGSTSGQPAPVQPVSQTPSTTAKPPGSVNTGTNQTSTSGPTDQQKTQLGGLLTQKNIAKNPKEIDDFMAGYTAQQSGKNLTPDQQKVLARLAPEIDDKSFSQQLDLLLKNIGQQKPGTP